MNCNEFAKDLMEKLQLKLDQFPLGNDNGLLMIESSFNLIDKTIDQLKEILSGYHFKSEDEEIEFFKIWMTALLSQSIFYSELFLIESDRPKNKRSTQTSYYGEKMDDIQEYIQRYASLNNYLVMEKTYLDRVYFLRNSEAPLIYPDLVHQTLDTRFCTVYTLHFARLKAMIRLMNYLAAMDHSGIRMPNQKSRRKDPLPVLQWTGSKVELVELVYALKTASVINKGSVNLSDLVLVFGEVFGTELKDCYRIFLQIKSRKKNRTVFLDACRDKLEAYMEEKDAG
ncbi:hypothetical protein J2X69_000034 [Algoriphagus sp. 4150]|uniref:RteC domain-containing protein n=1 Tax=Algoriphagus sp. 4150 TaxID=2817756 RepID=UPI00285C96DE|nr:RteC domain-containing protein [Algoriphagus sp. 4150]MDR7127706.1 hypothetical protein [Algoriphagus sp. 4150]